MKLTTLIITLLIISQIALAMILSHRGNQIQRLTKLQEQIIEALADQANTNDRLDMTDARQTDLIAHLADQPCPCSKDCKLAVGTDEWCEAHADSHGIDWVRSVINTQ
jgi:hypothetical protein